MSLFVSKKSLLWLVGNGSLDFNFLVEAARAFPLDTNKLSFLQKGQQRPRFRSPFVSICAWRLRILQCREDLSEVNEALQACPEKE